MTRTVLKEFLKLAALSIAYVTTARLLGLTHAAADANWGFVQALAIEGVLWYGIYLLPRVAEKFIPVVIILIFGTLSVGAQIVSARLYAVPIPGENLLPDWIIWAWRYALPAAATLAAVGIGVLETAEPAFAVVREKLAPPQTAAVRAVAGERLPPPPPPYDPALIVPTLVRRGPGRPRKATSVPETGNGNGHEGSPFGEAGETGSASS